MEIGGRSGGYGCDRRVGSSEPLEADVCSVSLPVSGWRRVLERLWRTRLVDSSDSLAERDTATGLFPLVSSHSPPAASPPGAQGASGPTWLRKRSTALVAGGENDARVFVPAPTPSSGLGAKPTTLTVFVVLTTTSSGAAAVASPWPPADISFDMGAHDQVELGGGARNNGGSARGWRSQLPLQLSRVHRRRCRHNMRGRTRYFTRNATPRAAPHATQQRLRVSGIKVATLLPAAARATVADVSSERS